MGLTLAVGLVSSAPAATHTWTGAGASGFWSNSQNWSGGVPAAAETDLRLVFPSGASRLDNTNNIDNLVATTISLPGTGYRLAGAGNGTNMVIKTVVLSNGPVAATITSSGASNVFLSSLDLVLGQEAGDVVTFRVTDATDVLRLDGALSGPAGLKKEGAGTLILSGDTDNTYAGSTQVRAGTLRLAQYRLGRPDNILLTAVPGDLDILGDLGAATVLYDQDDQIADTANVSIQSNSRLDLQGHRDEVRSLRGAGVVDFDGGTLIVNQQPSSAGDPNESRTSTGVLNDNGGVLTGTLIKRGSGELRLDVTGTGTPNYGTLTALHIEGGTVNLIHPLSNAFVLVNAPGAVLAGTTVAPQVAFAKSIYVAKGELRPGSAGPALPNPMYAGQLVMSVDTNTHSVFRAVLRSPANASRIVVAAGSGADGTVVLGGATLEVSCEFIPALNQKFTLIDKVSRGAITGTFLGLPEGATFTAGGRLFRITYQGGDGNDVVLTRMLSVVEFPPLIGPPILGYNASGDPHIQLSLTSLADQMYTIESSPNLGPPDNIGPPDTSHWTVLATVTANEVGQVIYTDRTVSSSPRKFYRFKPLLPPLPTGSWTIPLSQIPANLLAAARAHLANFDPSDGDLEPPDNNPNPWADAVFAPTAIQLNDPAYQGGATPAYVELKITTPPPVAGAGIPGEDRGFILLSLTPNDRPIVEFASEGPTEAETVLRRAQGAGIRKLVRFSSTFMVAEGDDGQLLAEFGTAPSIPVGPVPTNEVSFYHSYDSETHTYIRPTNAPPVFTRASSYGELRAAWATNPVVAAVRRARALRVQPGWRLLNGLRPPSLRVRVGETNRFILNEFFQSVALNIDSDETAIATVRPPAVGTGFEVVGLAPGKQLVRGVNKAGLELHYSLTVTAAGGAGAAGSFVAAGGDCVFYDVDKWIAGQGWYYDQPHYYQYEHDNWCDYTGCGPVALSMLAAWWDKHGVESAFYKLSSATIGQAHNFRFKFDSLATQDAPMDLGESEVFRNYDDLHELCNVTCEIISGAGSTLPANLAGAWEDYLNRIMEPLPSPQDEFGEDFVGGGWQSSWNYPFTDWNGGGTMVANGIKKGRPGVVGIGWWGDEHYVLAWAYKKYRRYEGCGNDQELDEVSRFFKCNMGWKSKRKWLNAEDVWLGLTANLWQRHAPSP